MCNVLEVPVRVHAHTRGNDPVDLGAGWIRGTQNTSVAVDKDGNIVAVGVGGEQFSEKEIKQLWETGCAVFSVLDDLVVVLDSHPDVGIPGYCLAVEYIQDEKSLGGPQS